jgi:hypothetical protein
MDFRNPQTTLALLDELEARGLTRFASGNCITPIRPHRSVGIGVTAP